MNSLITTAVLFSTMLYNSALSLSQQIGTESSGTILFANDLLPLITGNKTSQNVVFSPACIYTGLALTYLGAKGHTAAELRKVLKLKQEDEANFPFKYGNFLKSLVKNNKAEDNAPQLRMVNRIYVGHRIKISPQFNRIAEDNFDCKAENVDFSQGLTTVRKINKWVEEQTENKIKDLMQPDAVDGDTSAVLVNVIYFKGKWLHPFSTFSTHKSNFHVSATKSVEVDTMYTDDQFAYAELPELNAKALEMRYKDSDVSMLILLPDNIEGLQRLVKKMQGMGLNDITSKLALQSVDLFLPKFRIEFDIDLKESLKKLGCSTMFGANANLSGIFESKVPERISAVKHKAFLDCSEAGSEAAAATFTKFSFMSLNLDKKVFRADRSFAFFIHNKNAVLFAGTVVDF